MQLRLEFRHHLRSSRRFVFENIMDLEHVPVVHRRWFVSALFGSSRGGVLIRVEGRSNGKHQQVEWAVWANQRGELIPAILPAIAAAMLLAGKIPKEGIVAPGWISRDQLVAELSARGVNVAARSNPSDPWQLIGPAF